ncbi:hypothetical protein AGMMS49928_22150 [Spirochaetia bacterium]|nr:hypothetical protein AGMMS49928_22150 [Spirochaetia bacterium]
MISLEQVKLLESKVAKAIEYVKRVTGENKRLESTLESYQKRIDELEVLIQRFKEDQGKIEDSILSALDRLNQFEDALETVVSPEKGNSGNEPGKAASGKKAAAVPGPAAAPAEPKTGSKAAPAAPPPLPPAAEEDLFGGQEESIEIDLEATKETEPEIY